jgi:polyhydroxybutyrate depolymerase
MQAIMLALALAVGADPARQEWTVDDVKREALVVRPAKVENAPLVFVFHGHGGSMQNSSRRMALHALWPEAVVVYPQGLPTKGRLTDPEGKKAGWQSGPGDEKDRDLKLFDAMFEAMLKDKIDPNRVYVTGHSNGGGFTYLLWATRGEKLAAVAPSAAAGLQIINKLKPLPCLHFAGEKDPLVKFEWQERMMTAVKKVNGCEGEPKEWGGQCKLYSSKGGTPLVTCIYDGGHEYHKEAPALTVKFFKEHTRPTSRAP